jgi:hypothetical protein
MTFLPIVERELRVAARKSSTFWLRVSAALTSLVIGGAILLITSLSAFGMTAPGLTCFRVLTWMALIAAFAAGVFFTSNSLSEEKREGTLGLLFLTDLRGYDVAGGKLMAMSLRVFYALLAIFPMLAVTFLMGGVENAQFWKTALALVNALFFSLAAGLFISAISRDSQKAMAGTLILLLLFVLGGPWLDAIRKDLAGRSLRPLCSASSPGYVFAASGDHGWSLYWPGLGITQLLSWGLLALACLLVPHTWQEKKRRLDESRWRYAFKYGRQHRRLAFRRKWLERNPVLWLTCRDRWQSAVLWTGWILLTGVYVANAAIGGFEKAWRNWDNLNSLARMVLYLCAASQAGRLLVEARRSGLVELLIATPLSIRQIIGGQWRGWMRLYAVPVIGMLMVHFVGASCSKTVTWGVVTFQVGGVPFAPATISAALTLVNSVADLVALGWFGLWMGMTSKNSALATLKTIVFVEVIPWLVIVLLTLLGAYTISALQIVRKANLPSWVNTWMPVIVTTIPAGLSLVKDAGFVIWSRRRLYSAFREQASEGTRPIRVNIQPAASPAPPVAAPLIPA